MRISSNYRYKPSFGYDKQLNEELKDQLKTHPDRRWATTIETLNSHCNKLETNLRRAEKDKGKKDPHFDDYVDLFASTKQMLITLVETTFEHLKFADREFVHYRDEFIKRNESGSDDWRFETCEAIKEFVSPEILPDGKTNKPVLISVEKKPTQIQNKSTNKSLTSHLEAFEPTEKTPKGFCDVIGMDKLKRDLRERIVEYIQDPIQAQRDFEDYGKEIPKAVLLYGPPGCGKTYITQALSQEGNFPLYLLNIGKAGSQYMNLTAKNIKEAYDEAIRISEESNAPCILFMDEVDSIGFNRSDKMEPDDIKVVATLLQAMDKAQNSNVITLAATNKYNILDPAVKRRFTSKVFVDLPDEKAREGLVVKTLASMKRAKKLLSSEDDLKVIAKLLDGYTNDSICKIAKEAALCAMRRDRADVEIQDFELAIKETTEEKPNRENYLPEGRKKTNPIGFGK